MAQHNIYIKPSCINQAGLLLMILYNDKVVMSKSINKPKHRTREGL
jgi:hypothetical protein